MAKMDDINIFDYQAPTPEELLAAGSGATVEPLSSFEQFELERSRPSSDPVIRRLQSIGRGIGSFLVPETPLDVALSGVMAAKPIVAAGKGIVTLSHGTTKEAAKQIEKEGVITPKLGSYVEDMYIKRGDYADIDPKDYPPTASYFSTADEPSSAIGAMEAQIGIKLGKNLNDPISLDEIEKHGAIVLSDANPKTVFKMDEDYRTYNLMDEPAFIDEPLGFESEDIISFLPQKPKKILTGKELVKFVKENKPQSKGIQALPKDKDLVFVHNTSEEAIKSFDQMGGIPSPSLAVTKSDQPFTGFGNIQLIGKPEKFDPTVNPANKIYSADAYTPRAPKKIRLANRDAVVRLENDYYKLAEENGYEEVLEKGQDALRGLQKNSLFYPENRMDELDRFFDTPLAKEKFAKEKGLSEQEFDGDNFTAFGLNADFNEWAAKQKDKYLSQEGVFQYFDEFEQTMKTKPYTLDNVVDNMVTETQRGGEGGIGGFGANRLRAVMAEQFKDLPDIKARKEMLTPKGDHISSTLFDINEQVSNSLGKISDEAMDYSEDVLTAIGENLKFGSTLEKAVEDAFKTGYLSRVDDIAKSPKREEVMEDVATTLRLNAMRPVEYFEAKPTRAVGFDEFAGAIVPEGTSKEVIDILEKRGLKVVKQKFDDIDKDYGKGKIRQEFKDQFFSIGLPATGAAALSIENTDIFADDTE